MLTNLRSSWGLLLVYSGAISLVQFAQCVDMEALEAYSKMSCDTNTKGLDMLQAEEGDSLEVQKNHPVSA